MFSSWKAWFRSQLFIKTAKLKIFTKLAFSRFNTPNKSLPTLDESNCLFKLNKPSPNIPVLGFLSSLLVFKEKKNKKEKDKEWPKYHGVSTYGAIFLIWLT